MKIFRKIFEIITQSGSKTYCSCGHVIGINLPVCPYCGQRLQHVSNQPID